jgi:hypothetical protein
MLNLARSGVGGRSVASGLVGGAGVGSGGGGGIPPFLTPDVVFAGPLLPSRGLTIGQSANEITVTAMPNDPLNEGGFYQTTASQSNSGLISCETVIKSITASQAGQLLGAFMVQQYYGAVPANAITVGCALSWINSTDAVLIDFNLGALSAPFTVNFPYTIGLKLDQALGTATYEFDDGGNNNQSGAVTVLGAYDNTRPIFMSGVSNDLPNNAVAEFDFNTLTSDFTLASSSGSFEDYTTTEYCLPSIDGSRYVLGAAGQSATWVNGTIRCISNGAGGNNDWFVYDTPFSSSSGVSKGEISFASSLGGGTSHSASISYADANSASANAIVSLVFVPVTGVLLDKDSNVLASSLTMVAGTYHAWFEFDHATGTATYFDSLGNTGPLPTSGYTAADTLYRAAGCNADTTSGDEMEVFITFGELPYRNLSGNGFCEV